jgi:hypothetical protein
MLDKHVRGFLMNFSKKKEFFLVLFLHLNDGVNVFAGQFGCGKHIAKQTCMTLEFGCFVIVTFTTPGTEGQNRFQQFVACTPKRTRTQ